MRHRRPCAPLHSLPHPRARAGAPRRCCLSPAYGRCLEKGRSRPTSRKSQSDLNPSSSLSSLARASGVTRARRSGHTVVRGAVSRRGGFSAASLRRCQGQGVSPEPLRRPPLRERRLCHDTPHRGPATRRPPSLRCVAATHGVTLHMAATRLKLGGHSTSSHLAAFLSWRVGVTHASAHTHACARAPLLCAVSLGPCGDVIRNQMPGGVQLCFR